ncbi:hypothetical protein HKD37_20G055647 [Glycine soja]
MNILTAHNQRWEQELSPYNQYEEEKTPNLESMFEEFMAYHASSKANQNSMKNHEIHFGKSYSIENFQWEPELQPYYQNEAERGSNMDKLLMQFKETIKSTQGALQSVEIQVGVLAEEVTQFMMRREKYFVKVEAQEENPKKTIKKVFSKLIALLINGLTRKKRQGEHEETLSAILSLVTTTLLEIIWIVLPFFMKFMEFLAKRRNCKEDVFYVTYIPP